MKTLILTMITCLAITSCTKDKEQSTTANPQSDYRAAFAGNYNCMRISNSIYFNTPPPNDTVIDTSYFSMAVSIDSNSDTSILINGVSCGINASGHGSKYIIDEHGESSWDFKMDSLYLDSTGLIGHGLKYTYSIRGKKLK